MGLLAELGGDSNGVEGRAEGCKFVAEANAVGGFWLLG